MTTTSLTISDQLLTTTMFARMKMLKSQIDRPTFFADDIEKLAKEEEEGGERMLIPLNFTRHSSTTQLSTGYEPVNQAVSPLGETGHEAWGDWIRPVLISGHEERLNRGKAKILSMLDERVKDTYNGMRLEWQQALVTGNASNMTDCIGINGSDFTDGVLETSAFGSQSNSVHNVSKSTYATSVGWQNQVVDCQDQFSQFGLIGMYGMMTRVLSVSNPKKLRWYGSISGVNNIKNALGSQERYLSEAELDGGRRVMSFGDIPIQTLQDLPNAGTNTTGNPFTFILIDFENIQWITQKGYHFKPGAFETQSGYDVRASFLHLMGQMRVRWMASSGVIHSGETY